MGQEFAGGIERAARELERTQLLAGIANSHYFGMGGGVVGRRNAVAALAHHFAVAHNDTAQTARPVRYSYRRGPVG